MNEPQNLWRCILEDMQATLSPTHFDTWFKNTSLVSRDETSVTISVPDGFVKEWLQAKFAKEILTSLQKSEPAIQTVRYTIVPMPVPWRRRFARPMYRLASFIAGGAR